MPFFSPLALLYWLIMWDACLRMPSRPAIERDPRGDNVIAFPARR